MNKTGVLTAMCVIIVYSHVYSQDSVLTNIRESAYRVFIDATNCENDSEKIRLLSKSISMDPETYVANSKALDNEQLYIPYKLLANIYKYNKRYHDALSTYGNILVRMCNPDGRLWYDIADTWEKIGDKDHALNYYWKAADSKYLSGFDNREYLYNAFKRCASLTIKGEIEKEIKTYNDWTSYYHMYMYYNELGNGDTQETADNLINCNKYIQKSINMYSKDNKNESDVLTQLINIQKMVLKDIESFLNNKSNK